MAKTFYVSDTHFGHKNILKYKDKNRPFDSTKEHDDYLVDAWNKAVKPEDTVYHLGDVVCKNGDNLDILNRLNGKKILLMGNHEDQHIDEYRKHFDDCKAYMTENDVLFSHYPVHPTQLNFRQKFNVHGHMHKEMIDDDRYINISIENTNLAPIEHDDLMQIIANRRKKVTIKK